MNEKNYKKISAYDTVSNPESADIIPTVHTDVNGNKVNRNIPFSTLKGEVGPAGPANELSIGSVSGGEAADATITGEAPAQTLNLVLPKGDTGSQGNPGVDGADGREVEIQKGVTHIQWRYVGDTIWTDLVALSTLKGDKGDAGTDGIDGQAATVTVGSTTTGSPGTNATVTNSGTSSAAVLQFTIPRGESGTNGIDGLDGKTVLSGAGAPSGGLGKDGDFYIDISSWNIYGPKAGGAWGASTSLVGPAGSGTGDMLASVYDPNSKLSDAFAMDNMVEGSDKKIMTSAERTKLAGIETGAEVNDVTSVAGKTGAVSLVKGDVGLGSVDNTSDVNKPVSTAQQAALDGKANSSHTHPTTDLTATGGTSTSFLRKDNTWATPTNTTYSEITDAEIDAGTDSTSRTISGRRAQKIVDKARTGLATSTDLTSHTSNTSNPHSVTKSQVGLGNVDNTSDANKPVSTATQTALDDKVAKDELVVNVLDYGAVADGTTDDTAAIQAALNILQTTGGGTLYIPYGTYAVHSALWLRENIRIIGDNVRFIKTNSAAGGVFFAGTSTRGQGYGAGRSNIYCRGITFVGNFSTSTNGCGFAIHHTDNLLVEDCSFEQTAGNGHAIDMQGCSNVTIRRCSFKGFNFTTSYGVEAIQLDSSIPGGGSVSDNSSTYDGLGCKNITVENCVFTSLDVGGTTYPAMNALGSHGYAEGFPHTNIKFINNVLDSPSADTTSNYIGTLHFTGVQDIEISGNTFHGGGVNNHAINFYPGTTAISTTTWEAITPGTPLAPKKVWITDNVFEGYNHTSLYQVVKVVGSSGAPAADVHISDNTFRECAPTSSGGSGPFLMNLAYIFRLIVSNNTSDSEYKFTTTSNITGEATSNNLKGSIATMSKSVDANGWTVYDYGAWKEYAQQVTIPAASTTLSYTNSPTLPNGGVRNDFFPTITSGIDARVILGLSNVQNTSLDYYSIAYVTTTGTASSFPATLRLVEK